MSYNAARAKVEATVFITPWGVESIGPVLNNALMPVVTPASTAWPVNNKAFYIPFVLAKSATVLKLFWANGATVAGTNNIDVGIYDASGNRLVSTGSTAQGTASIVQEVDVTDTILGRGQYFLAMSCSNTAATFSLSSSSTTQVGRLIGILEQTSALPLPNPATLAVCSATFVVPQFGAALRTLAA